MSNIGNFLPTQPPFRVAPIGAAENNVDGDMKKGNMALDPSDCQRKKRKVCWLILALVIFVILLLLCTIMGYMLTRQSGL